jgi:hypothetical protein
MATENDLKDIGLGLDDADFEKYLDVIAGALAVHVDRERIRHGLWKRYSARDQATTAKTKLERVLNTLNMDTVDDDLTANAIEELFDIINYSVFAVRLLRGRDAV